MPKVLRIINRFNLGGPTLNVAYLSKYMAPEFETMLVGGMNSESEKNSEYIVRNLGLEPVIIPEMMREINPFNDWIALRKIKKLIQEFKPDIVHTHASKAGALGRKAAFDLNVPIILHTFHGHVFDAYFNKYVSGFYKRVERNLAKKSSRIIAISDKQKEELAHRYFICDEKKIEVVPLGFDLNRFREDMDIKRKVFREKFLIDDDEIAIGIVGRIVPVKNHPLFINAIRYLLDHSSKKIRAFVIGDGEDRKKTEQLANAMKINYTDINRQFIKAPLTFMSWMSQMDEVISGMDIIALTSFNEGTPVSLIEAKAASKSIVSTNVGGIENILSHNSSALLSESGDDAEFMQNLLRLVEHSEERNFIAHNGCELIHEKFHYSRLINDMRKIYISLLNKDMG